MRLDGVRIDYCWRGPVIDHEIDALHAEAFDHAADGVPWTVRLERHSIGWVTAGTGGDLVGFANVVGDGGAHAVLLDVMVAVSARGHGVGTEVVRAACAGARSLGCAWVHVDFEERLASFYAGACGFSGTAAGLLRL